jgi:outer membrane protein assembly factor BamD
LPYSTLLELTISGESKPDLYHRLALNRLPWHFPRDFDGAFRRMSVLLRVLPLRGLVRVLAVAVVAVPLAACETISSINPFASAKATSDLQKEEPAEVLFNDGLARLQSKNFDGAARKFAELDKQYPYTNWSKRSLLLQTFSNYENRNYEDTIANGRRFVQLYPADKDAAYAQYLVGMSYFNQMPDVSRDQERAQRALLAMDELINKWPQSEYVPDARQRVSVARDQLAAKEMDVGRYYLEQRNYTGAVNRFREVLTRYQTTRHTEEALMRITEAYMSLGIVPEAQTAAAVLGHNFPDSQWYKDAYKLLQTGGVEPRENEGSWISRAFRGFRRGIGI